jgi:betaine-aldehyde dehydrogenase
VPEAREADVDRAVAAAREAFDRGPWPRLAPGERADVMARLLAILQERSAELAVTITSEMGCPISFSHMGQVMAANMVLDYYVRLAREYRFEEVRPGMLGPALVRREPVGVAGCIVPWNVPLFVIMLKLGPALAAGATGCSSPRPRRRSTRSRSARRSRPPACLRAWSTSCRRAARWASTWSGTPAPTRSRSRGARRRTADRVDLRRGLKRDARAGRQVGGHHPTTRSREHDRRPPGSANNGQAAWQSRILASPGATTRCARRSSRVRAMPVGDPMDPATMVWPARRRLASGPRRGLHPHRPRGGEGGAAAGA